MATLAQEAARFYECDHVHAYAVTADGTSHCVFCDKAECRHNNSRTETRTTPASRGYFGWNPEYEYEVSICNVCGEVSKVIPAANWDLLDDDIPL